jgi:endonuclease YncB( thermonuclease family)
MNNVVSISLAIILIVASGALAIRLADQVPDINSLLKPQFVNNPSLMRDVPATVKRVIDGDTIELASGEKVRYIGVDTPEKVSPTVSTQCFADEASRYNQSLVEGKNVRLSQDTSARDRYGRLLAYVYLEDGRFLNEELVKNGYAFSSAYPPDIANQRVLEQAQESARSQSLGLWKQCEILIDKSGRYHTNILVMP